MERQSPPTPRLQVLLKQPAKCIFFSCVDFIQKQDRVTMRTEITWQRESVMLGSNLDKHRARNLLHPNMPCKRLHVEEFWTGVRDVHGNGLKKREISEERRFKSDLKLFRVTRKG